MNLLNDQANATRTNTDLNELLRFIMETVPQPKAIQNLQIKDPPGVAAFRWHQREYIVRPSLQVFELKGKEVFVTASTMLLQTAFMRKRTTNKVLEVAVETLQQVEGFIKGNSVEKGFTLLASVKKTLSGLANR